MSRTKESLAFRVLSVVFVVGAVLAFVINAQPNELNVSRSIVIDASEKEIFPYLNNFHNFVQWSPWADLDPEAEYTFSGPDEGMRAAMSWSGNSKVGVGTDTIIESIPYELVRVRLDFDKPFKSTAFAEFVLEEADDGTKITWSMESEKNFIMKAMGLVMDCDKMMGGDFEKGLQNLKELVEQ